MYMKSNIIASLICNLNTYTKIIYYFVCRDQRKNNKLRMSQKFNRVSYNITFTRAI